MATATASEVPTKAGSLRWPLLLAYLAGVVVAESLVAFGDPALGLGTHVVFVFALLFLSVAVRSRDALLAPALVAVSLASLIRVYSLAVPRFEFDQLTWLGLVSVPLLVSVATVVVVQRFRVRDLGLRFRSWRDLPTQIGIGLTGIPFGVIEYYILTPDPKDWLGPEFVLSAALMGSVVLFLATGLSEELIFRAIILRRAIDAVGVRGAILFVTGIFAALHIFFQDPRDLLFVFGVGLFFAYVVITTGNLWGAIFSHTLGNVVLYLIAPYVLA